MYSSKVCPMLEYAVPVWHPGMTQEHIDDLESIQMRAMNITFPNLDYISALNECNIPTMCSVQSVFSQNVLQRMQDNNDKLNRILPPPILGILTKP